MPMTTPETVNICPACQTSADPAEAVCTACGHALPTRPAVATALSASDTAARLPTPGEKPQPWWRNSALQIWVVLIVIVLASIVLLQPWKSSVGWILVAVVVAALGFDFINGMNDSANAIATVVSTRVLTPLAALLMASVLNFFGAVAFEGVAKTIAGKLVAAHALPDVTMIMILCGLLGAVAWSWLMTVYGLPVSLSHSLIGGLVGVLIVAGIGINQDSISSIVIWMVLAPMLGFVGGWLLMLTIMWAFRRVASHKLNRHFRFWQVFSAGSMAFSHGANDAQKAMGIITLALVAAGVHQVAPGADGPSIPLWVKAACAIVIALGTGLGGWRVIRTLGHRMIKLQPVHGFAAETAAACTIQLATILHMPVSTTHVISSSIMGVGASKRLSAVRWGVAGNILFAWVLTIPACGLTGALLYALLRSLGVT